MLKGRGETAPLWVRVAPERRDSLFRTVEYLGKHGFHAQTIADICGCTVSQVYLACAKLGIRLRDYRDGKNQTAKSVIRTAPRVMKEVPKKARA